MNSINNTKLRLVGIASGIDTDTVVQQLMFAEKQPLYKLQRQRQLAEWKQEAYREFTNALRSFKEQFFDIAKRTSYLLSETAFKTFKVSSSADEYVTARGTISAQNGSHTVKVVNLATAYRVTGEKGVSKAISGDLADGINLSELNGKTIKVTLDGVEKELKLEDFSGLDGENDFEKLEKGLQNLLNDAFGSGKVAVSADDVNKTISLTTEEGSTRLTLSSGSNNDGLSYLGITSGASNRIALSNTLGELSGKLKNSLDITDGKISFEINGKTFTFSEDDTLKKVVNTINNDAEVNVALSYDEIQDRFIMTSKQTGAGQNISFQGQFFEALGIQDINPGQNPDDSEAGIYEGQDAEVYIDGIKIVRSTNTFTVNGVEYTLKKMHEEGISETTITVEQDIDTVFNSIKSFVDEYNKLVDMFNTKLTEKYDRNYMPLTDDEKDEMTEEEIKKWEDKAKTGLLRNDSILQQIQQSMRTALMDTVEGVGISLSSIGISSSSYLDKGRLKIDEDKLKQALRERPDEVKELFIKTSDTVPHYDRDLTSGQRKIRYKEVGVFYRISDILNDYISTIRDKNGNKGILLEKAGMEGDLSQFDSSLSKEISLYDERISEMYVKLAEKEESYYRKFTELEKYMSQMNSQMNWLLSQLGSFQYG